MNIFVKFDLTYACKMILKDQLEKIGIEYQIISLNEVEFTQNLTDQQREQLKDAFEHYGIEIIDNQKTALVQKIKDTIVEMVWKDDNMPNVTTSTYLADKLHHSYGYLSNLFSEVTYTTIENFIIIQKIERAKQMLLSEKYTLTEISYELNYSSVAHLSNQFKKTTGLTPSSFQRIIKRRKELQQSK